MNKMYRSRRDSMITGLCGGLAEKMNINSNLLRVIVAAAVFFSVFSLIPIYIIASIIIPKEPIQHSYHHNPSYGGSGGSRGPYHANYNHFGGSEKRYSEQSNNRQSTESPIDDMMEGLEEKAMRRELDELRAKMAKLEKEDN